MLSKWHSHCVFVCWLHPSLLSSPLLNICLFSKGLVLGLRGDKSSKHNLYICPRPCLHHGSSSSEKHHSDVSPQSSPVIKLFICKHCVSTCQAAITDENIKNQWLHVSARSERHLGIKCNHKISCQYPHFTSHIYAFNCIYFILHFINYCILRYYLGVMCTCKVVMWKIKNGLKV